MKLSEIVTEIGGTLEGDGSVEINGVESLTEARTGDITFIASPRYASLAASTQASAMLVYREWEGSCPCPVVRIDNPNHVFGKIAVMVTPPPVNFGIGIHKTAIIADNVKLGDNLYIGPNCVIEEGASIGSGCVLVAGCYIGHGVVIGENCLIYAQASIRERVTIGNRVIIHNGAVIGSDGFGYTPDENGVWQKVLQSGIVEVQDDAEIGANTTIDRARFGKTKIAKGVKIDNLVHIAHNVTIGEHTAIAALAGIAGSTSIGSRVQIGGQTGITGHIHIGDGSITAAQSGVTKDVAPKTLVSGYPAMEHRKATRNHAAIMRIPALKKRVKAIEAELEELREAVNQAKDEE
jgi:UDP-3-O-[3-hydroxymyristoyl] glucosamine N-acyltransferase